MSDEQDDEYDVFDALGELDDRPKREVKYGGTHKKSNRISAEVSTSPAQRDASDSNYTGPYTLDDPRTNGWFKATKQDAWDKIVNAKSRGEHRNDTLNKEAANLMSGIVLNDLATEGEIRDFLTDAANASGLDIDANCGPIGIENTISSGFDAGRNKYGRRTNLPRMEPGAQSTPTPPSADAAPAAQRGTGPGARLVKMGRFSELADRRPTWLWHYNGHGRIQQNTLCIFGGPAGTGKSTAARWVAAEMTNGTLEGEWYGQPQNVAYLAIEEDLDAMVKPSLRAAGADITRLFYPIVEMDGTERILSSRADEAALTEELLDNNIRMLVVDPIMGTLGATVDVYRNNEVREAIQPFLNIAQAMNGLVIGIAHYRKSGAASGTAAITGSAAFGEVARSIFGFMKGGMDPDEPRVMSQSKNSAGREDLALQYALDLVPVLYDDGVATEMTRFKILGDSAVTVEDLMSEGGAQVRTKLQEASEWLHDYLQMNGPTASKQVKLDAKKDADISDATLNRAMGALKVVCTSRSVEGKPRVTFWDLPPDPKLVADERYAESGDEDWDI